MIPRRHLALAILSGGAYSASPDGVVIDAGDDIRAVITEIDGAVAVAVRGTLITSVDNILTDLDALPVVHANLGSVPRGFLLAAMSLLPLVEAQIAGRPVVVTGHSLGGSVAILLAAMLSVPPIEVVAFEPARSGMAGIVGCMSSINGTIYRYGDDPVPEVPPWPYRHPWNVTAIGHSMPDPISCHSIDVVIAWLQGEVATTT